MGMNLIFTGMGKSRSRKGLEGDLVILSLVQHPHLGDVESVAPRLLVADIY